MRNHSVEVNCRCCKEYYTLLVDIKDYINWSTGRVLTQTAFPYLSAGERELLISGTCPTCWDKMFRGEEDE